MTKKELSQLYWLRREIEEDRRRLDELEAIAASPASPRYDGMPHAPGAGDGMARMAAEIADLKAIISAKQQLCVHECKRLARYISSIPDSRTRLIFAFRFMEGLSWRQIAVRVGGGNTEDSVKKTCYRYLDRENQTSD